MVAEWGNYPRIRAQGGERKKKIAAFPFCILQAFRRGGMNKQLLTFFALLGTFVFAATAMADPAVTAKLAGRHAHRLLIQTARHASFAGSTLRLEGVGAESVMFSDRPQRIADTMPTARLITLWARKGGTFEKVPPNAGITFIANDRLGTATVELSKPQLDGTNLSYQVRVLEGKLPSAATTVSLFIDDFCASCADGGF
jgi:hypothetical protein